MVGSVQLRLAMSSPRRTPINLAVNSSYKNK